MIRVNFSTHKCPTWNWGLIFILAHWSYSKFKDILQAFNVYKIPEIENQTVDCWDADEI